VNRRAFLLQTLAGTATNSIPTAPPVDPFSAARRIGNLTPAAPSRHINVVTWNIDRGTQLSAIVESLASCRADLILLQEVDWNTHRTGFADIAAELSKRLQQNAVYGIEFEELSQEEPGKPAYIGQATLTRLPIVNSRVLRFRNQSGFWKPHSWIPSGMPLMQRRQGNRIALVTELRFNGGTLVVYNAHLESRSMGLIQSAQLDEMLADAQRYPSATPILLGGDLNTKYFPSVFLRKLERAGFQSALGQRIERTHTIMLSLDWLFARGPVAWGSGAVEQALQGSDHYPIAAALTAQ
jgi:endonuclease/exonuclease/phosphatase family metal-dependent hydrolase